MAHLLTADSQSTRQCKQLSVWTLVTFFLVNHLSAIFTKPTDGLELTAFEKGLRALVQGQLKPCLTIEVEGLRAGCSLMAALEAETAAVKDLAARRKSDNSRFSISPDACAYRLQGGPSLHKFAATMHPYLKHVLKRYATFHRHCTEYDNLRDVYDSKKNPQCRYVMWSCTFGLGNKLMSLLSTLLYAIISQRVLLIESPGWESLFCEPFPGSKLQVPEGFSLVEMYTSLSFADFRKLNCGESTTKEPRCIRSVVVVVFTGESKRQDHSFLVCPTAMAAVREIPFLHFRNSNQHFAMGFFLNPALRPLLELLFPEHNVFHMLAQFFLSPSDAVWVQIKSFYERNLQPASRNVGVQLRESKGEYRQHYDDVVPLCILNKAALCPIELEAQLEREKRVAQSPSSSESNISRPLVSVYISSLVGGHYKSLKQSVPKLEPKMLQRFVVVAQVISTDSHFKTSFSKFALLRCT
uniref:Fucosyltransferase n=2 Tax=Physcomitrium patens TaxID=3218 RepID=A0A7I4EL71_PHYPA